MDTPVRLTTTGRNLPYGITVLPATRHKWTRPALTPASKLVVGGHVPGAFVWPVTLTFDL